MSRAVLLCCCLLAGQAGVRGAETLREAIARGDAARAGGRPAEAIAAYDAARGMVDAGNRRALAGLLYRKALALQDGGRFLEASKTVELASEQHGHRAFEELLAELETQAAAVVTPAEQIVRALGVARGFPPRGGKPQAVGVPVEFEHDSVRLTERGNRQAAEMAAAMRSESFRGSRFLLVGHTDLRGADGYNLRLSRERAASLRDRLEREFGIARGRIEAEGRGEAEPRSTGRSEADHARNRRVELRLLR